MGPTRNADIHLGMVDKQIQHFEMLIAKEEAKGDKANLKQINHLLRCKSVFQKSVASIIDNHWASEISKQLDDYILKIKDNYENEEVRNKMCRAGYLAFAGAVLTMGGPACGGGFNVLSQYIGKDLSYLTTFVKDAGPLLSSPIYQGASSFGSVAKDEKDGINTHLQNLKAQLDRHFDELNRSQDKSKNERDEALQALKKALDAEITAFAAIAK